MQIRSIWYLQCKKKLREALDKQVLMEEEKHYQLNEVSSEYAQKISDLKDKLAEKLQQGEEHSDEIEQLKVRIANVNAEKEAQEVRIHAVSDQFLAEIKCLQALIASEDNFKQQAFNDLMELQARLQAAETQQVLQAKNYLQRAEDLRHQLQNEHKQMLAQNKATQQLQASISLEKLSREQRRHHEELDNRITIEQADRRRAESLLQNQVNNLTNDTHRLGNLATSLECQLTQANSKIRGVSRRDHSPAGESPRSGSSDCRPCQQSK